MYEDPNMVVDGNVYRPRKWHERPALAFLAGTVLLIVGLGIAIGFLAVLN